MDFVDIVTIKVQSGNGGDGGIYFLREKYVPNGGPAGGDGGNGGSVVLVADNNLQTLLDFKFKHKFIASAGENGRIKNQYGKKAEDLVVRVPVGTVVKDNLTGKIIADLSDDKQTFVVAKGGRGGRGNSKFATSTNKAPHYSEPGTAGVEREIVLELKSIADVGLVGLPNAGKSSLLSVVSASKPKIANYPFTTLTPNLGVVKLSGENDGFVMADIPGLIEGAHKGIGLGHKFLRHVERCRLLLHLVDISTENPVFDFETINHELVLYPGDIENKQKIVVLNKTDLLLPEDVELIKEEFANLGVKVFTISTIAHQGIKDLVDFISQVLPTIPKDAYTPVEDEEELDTKEEVKIYKDEDDYYVVEHQRIQKLLALTDVYDERALNRFMKIITGAGVLQKLKEMNVQLGDTIKIGDFQFDYYPDE
jgi:GTP-binding protein